MRRSEVQLILTSSLLYSVPGESVYYHPHIHGLVLAGLMKEETKRDPPLRSSLAQEGNQATWFSDFIPSLEVYIGEPE